MSSGADVLTVAERTLRSVDARLLDDEARRAALEVFHRKAGYGELARAIAHHWSSVRRNYEWQEIDELIDQLAEISPALAETSAPPPVGPGAAHVREPEQGAGADLDDVITVVQDPKHILGKQFKIVGDKVEKKSAVSTSFAYAKQHRVRDAQTLAELLGKVANDQHLAVINASFPGVPIGERFALLSEKEFAKRLKRKTREEMAGIHEIEVDGKKMRAVGRFKENVRPSSWQLLDRDIDEHTPPEVAQLDDDAWIIKLEELLPGVSRATIVRMASVSSRVARNGTPIGSGNSHHWVQIADAADVERTRIALMARAIVRGLIWLKPRRSRKTGQVVGHGHATLIDASVWTPGRFVFCGKPVVSRGLEVLPPSIEVVNG